MQYRSRRSTTFGALALAFAVLATGCGGSDEKSTGRGDGGTTETTEDAGTPTPGGTLTYALEAESSSGYCLAEGQLAAGGMMVSNAVFDPLMAYDDQLVARPYLAETVETNADKSEYTFKLRSGVKFHDGTDLTADVVAQNINNWRGDADTLAKSGRAPLLFRFVLQNIKSVEVVDPLTVKVTANTPWPAFPDYLAHGRLGIMAEAQMNGSPQECAENLIGTGPFKLVKWTRNQKMELERNPNYWRKDKNGVQLPYLDKLNFIPIEGGPQRFDALDGGTANALHTSSQEVFDSIQDEPDRFSFVAEPAGHREVGYGLVQLEKAPLNDKDVRLHVGMAIDRDRLNDINSGGEFDVANGPFDSEVMGYLEDPGIPPYDPAKAAEFFKGKDISFTITFSTDPATEAVAEDVKRQLGEVGVNVTIDEQDQATLVNTAIGGNYNVILFRLHAGTDPDYQYHWWHSGMPTNFGKLNDPRIDEDLEKGRIEQDPDKRREYYEDLNRPFAEGGYYLWNWYTEWGIGTTADVHNIAGTTNPDGSKGMGLQWGIHFLTEAWIEQ